MNKSDWLRIAEWLPLYAVMGAIALTMEQFPGQIYPQGWELYTVTALTFAPLAFAAFVYRYLWRRH